MAQFSQARYDTSTTMAGDARATRTGDSRTSRMADYRYTDGEWPQGPDVDDVSTARVSVWATLGLMTGLVGVCLALTGLLAPEGAALGAAGLLMSVIGLVTTSRPAVAGRGLAVLGLLLGLAAGALGGLAMTGAVGFPNSGEDHVLSLHHWLVDHWSWLDRW
jgi:hypothetical protein